MNEETRRTFKARTAAISSIRRFMEKNEFMEVETPMLHTIPGGAAAKPFITHHNALDMEMFLRIAPELYLKRLVVGGFDRVFEINRNFRNEGVSTRHNPEFTMMEFYAAYTDYKWMMNFTEEMIRQAAIDAHGTATLTYGGRELDLAKPFHRLTIVEAINKYAPRYTPSSCTTRTSSRRNCRSSASSRSPLLAWARCNWRCSRKPPKRSCGSRPSSSTTRPKCRHWRAPPTRQPASPSASSCSWSAARSPTASRS